MTQPASTAATTADEPRVRRAARLAGSSESPITNHQSRLFTWPVRIYWEDTDAGGVVYHARYLHFLERARTEWLRARGHGQQRLREEDGIVFVVHRMELDFNAPARLDDLLVASVDVVESRSASFTVRQTLRREGEEKILLDARVRIACLDAARFRPRPIPEHLIEGINKT